MKEKEIYKDIIGYENMYQISNYGKIKSLERKAPCRNCYKWKYKEVENA